jgi:heterotetrameric sarcosine oxidase delta subunit
MDPHRALRQYADAGGAMLLIPCPWCGPRDEVEFRYGGQAGVAYPPDPEALTDAEWADFLFMRDNPKGWWRERWYHVHGCRRWFDIERNTATNEIRDHSERGP